MSILDGQPVDKQLVLKCHAALTDEHRRYWNNRHVSNEILNEFLIGFGDFFGESWFTIPVPDARDNSIYLKLKAPPDSKSEVKGKFYPKGSEASLYPLPRLASSTGQLVICEGEPDCLALRTHGIDAVCSTAGAGTFKEEWVHRFPSGIKIILAFDIDDAGKKGREKALELFMRLRPDMRIGVANFPAALKEWGKDVTDFFQHPLLWPKEGCPAPSCSTNG
jgi:hypothetical protein